MHHIDDRALQELAALRNGAAHAYLSASYAQLQERLVALGDVEQVRWAQGQAQAVRRLLEYIDPASFTTNGKRG